MIKIIDYGVGNVQSFLNLYKRIGVKAERAVSTNDLDNATKLILPGVGHFDHAINLLRDSVMFDSIENLVLNKQIPILGICVGMQILANSSEEGTLPGLGWISGEIKYLNVPGDKSNYPLPHMGWNNINIKKNNRLFHDMDIENLQFYFLHSYYFNLHNKEFMLASVNYALEFPCIIRSNNIYGIQCHPEKSHDWGEKILKNFSQI